MSLAFMFMVTVIFASRSAFGSVAAFQDVLGTQRELLVQR